MQTSMISSKMAAGSVHDPSQGPGQVDRWWPIPLQMHIAEKGCSVTLEHSPEGLIECNQHIKEGERGTSGPKLQKKIGKET